MNIPAKYVIAITAALGLVMSVLDNTIVNVALVPMAEALHADLGSIQWVVTGYFLAQAAMIPVAGYFATRFGTKRVFTLSLVFFTLGSLLCALAHTETQLIAFRVIQGLGGGALFPLSNAIAFQAFPVDERANASAIVSVPTLLAPAFGPTVGGFLTTAFGWEYIFLLNVPIGILAVFMVLRNLPADPKQRETAQKGFDYVGLSLSILGVVAMVYGFSLVSETVPGSQTALNPRGTLNGWGYWPVWVFIIAGLSMLLAFAAYELRLSEDPVLDLRLLGQRVFAVTSFITWTVASMVFGSLLLLVIFLQQVRQPPLSALDAGLVLMPQGLTAALAVAVSSRLYIWFGVRRVVLVGSLGLILSSYALTQTPPDADWRWLTPWLMLRGFAFGFTFIPVQTKALEALSGAALSKGSSLFNVTRQIASSIGIAVLITFFVQRTTFHINQLRDVLLPTGGSANPSNPEFQAALQQMALQAGTASTQEVFVLVTGSAVLVLLLAFFLPGQTKTRPPEEQRAPMLMD